MLQSDFWGVPAERLNPEIVKLAFSQAQDRQKDLDSIASNLSSKVYNLISVLAAILFASIGFYLTHASEGREIVVSTLFCAVYCFALIIYLIKKAYTGHYIGYGVSPSLFFQPEFYGDNKDSNLLEMYRQLLIGLEDTHLKNGHENTRRWKVLYDALYAAILLPALLLVIYLWFWCPCQVVGF